MIRWRPKQVTHRSGLRRCSTLRSGFGMERMSGRKPARVHSTQRPIGQRHESSGNAGHRVASTRTIPSSVVSRWAADWKLLLRLACCVALFVIPEELRGQSPEADNDSQSNSSQDVAELYTNHVKPLLKAKCYSCHGALAQQGGLRVDTVAFLKAGGDSGPAVASNASESLLMRRVIDHQLGERMPLEGVPLDDEQLQLLRSWIELGYPAPVDEQPEEDPNQHWAFKSPELVPPPLNDLSIERASSPESTAYGTLDQWVNIELERRGLEPLGEAPRDTLLRRLSLDLTGLPPDPEDLRQFRNDPRPDAYERYVDRFLASPTFGQRWGRHWMDVWRYADWFGRRSVPDVWNSAPQIWRWRDWIVDGVNADLGYDQRIQLMLAADEIAPEQPDQSVATGYLIRNWYALNPNDWMRANVEHSARAFLGLSLQCAHCHDHKYDPITQNDYFAFRAFFEPLGVRQDQLPGEEDPGPFQEYEYSSLRRVERRGRVSAYDRNPLAPTWVYAGGDERNRLPNQEPVQPYPPRFLTPSTFAVPPTALPTMAWYPGLDPRWIEAERQKLIDQISVLEHQPLPLSQPAASEELLAAIDRLRQAIEAELVRPDLPAANRPIAGLRSLQLDATTGRRIIQRHLSPAAQPLSEPRLSVDLRLFNSTHFNMQLARSSAQGLTAGYVGFENGRILAYEPNSFTEIVVAEFEPPFPITLRVEWLFQFDEDQALLSVTNLDSNTTLAHQIPIAINGWTLAANPDQPITFDARNGSVAFIDQLRMDDVANPGHPPLLFDDFEAAPDQDLDLDGQEIVGVEGWSLSHLSLAGAWSRVASVKLESSLLDLASQVEQLAAARLTAVPNSSSPELQLAKLTAELRAFDARVLAERARMEHRENTEPSVRQQTRELVLSAAKAYQEFLEVERTTRLPAALAALHQARALPLTDAQRPAKIDAAEKQLSSLLIVQVVDSAEVANSETNSPTVDWDFDQPLPYPALSRTYPETSTGRRAALARWMTDRNHPLTARVAVNHVWARHFQRPIVATVDDFGRNGAPPTHQQLLDNLAVELMDSGWSLKQIHRRIVTSATYRRDAGRVDSQATAQRIARQTQLDPDNQWLWKRSPGRMEAEVVRDSILAQAERLDFRLSGQELENSEAFTSARRSLYFSCQPEIDGRSEFAALFDAPDPTQCYRRTRSLMPQQALALTNSQLVHEQSLAVVRRLLLELNESYGQEKLPADGNAALDRVSDVDSEEPELDGLFVVLAFQTILSRDPTSAESEACANFLRSAFDQAEPESHERARAGLIRVLWNHHEFVTIR